MKLLRWGRSAYESDESLDLEARLMEGVEVLHHVGPNPSLDGIDVLATTSKVTVTEAELRQVSMVVTTTSGYEHIDVEAARRVGTLVARCPLARRDAVVESALAMGIALLRDFESFQRDAEAGDWTRDQLIPRSLTLVRGTAVGIVGHGVIGARAAEVWRALGAKVWISDPAMPQSPSFDELIDACTVINLHCSLNPQNRSLVDSAVLSKMKPGSVVLNTARGKLVDADALLAAPHVRAGLDVFPDEPYPRLAELARRPHTLLTPHAAGYHDGLGESVARELADAVLRFMAGKAPAHTVQ
jgi:phosphoglycerate dehydrogenase-like enzyme